MPCDLTRDWEVFESAPARCVQISFVIVFTSVLTSLKMRRCVLAATVSGLSQQRQRKVGFCSLEATAVLMPSRSPLAIIAAMRPRSRRSNFVAKPAFSWVLATVEESSRTISRRSNSRELDVSTCPALVCSSDRRLPSECEFSASTIRKCSISSRVRFAVAASMTVPSGVSCSSRRLVSVISTAPMRLASSSTNDNSGANDKAACAATTPASSASK
mmetsp:Transcript_11030/g.35166  ORF Transcript_11030/g.35166 Transcript_11030/m.35166 type:complete len:216 (-) Transcript_11030:463-1110(-)